MKKLGKTNNASAVIALVIIAMIAIATFFVFLYSNPKTRAFEPDFGSLIGGSLGGIGTLLAVIFSIRAGQSQASEMRHDNIRPLLNIWHLNGADNPDVVRQSDIYDWVCNFHDSKIEKKNVFLENMTPDDRAKSFSRFIVLKNIGLGTAINLELEIKSGNKILKTDQHLHLEKDAKTIRRFIIPAITAPSRIAGSYSFRFTYSDMLGKEYSQDLVIELIETTSAKSGIDLASYVNTTIQLPRDV